MIFFNLWALRVVTRTESSFSCQGLLRGVSQDIGEGGLSLRGVVGFDGFGGSGEHVALDFFACPFLRKHWTKRQPWQF